MDIYLFESNLRKLYKDEIWIDFEVVVLERNIYIKGSVDFTYGQDFEIYIYNAKMSPLLDGWTVDCEFNRIFSIRENKITFIDDDGGVIEFSGEKYLGNIQTIIYHEDPSVDLKEYLIKPEYRDLSCLNEIYDMERFYDLDF
ncbi:hypothetical protein EC844_12919 [Acinetobacter calcoaceticus]|uniref:Uncharacterized protein n=1 Tax=Acinetobacter calcoaceticus TaxID=471 RepID=A0A4R1XDS8_ACICA|nr:hypothetical protein EC844_12919 [Acinetobacter calcoaceticus]